MPPAPEHRAQGARIQAPPHPHAFCRSQSPGWPPVCPPASLAPASSAPAGCSLWTEKVRLQGEPAYGRRGACTGRGRDACRQKACQLAETHAGEERGKLTGAGQCARGSGMRGCTERGGLRGRSGRARRTRGTRVVGSRAGQGRARQLLPALSDSPDA